MAYQVSKQKSRAVTTAAKGDAENTGAPGPTPAPAKTYVNPNVENVRQFTPSYGSNRDNSRSNVDPGQRRNSPLADELKRVGAGGDSGDHLQDVIEHGTARNNSVDLQASQTRNVSDTPYPAAFGQRSRQADSGSPGGIVPAKVGAVEGQPVRKPQ